jgi:hypothetical protein
VRGSPAGSDQRRAAWRAATGGRALAGSWPPLPQRVFLALLAWAPLALAVAYGGDVLTGCGRGAVSCAPFVPPLQLALAVALLGLLLLVPRGAYLAAAGTIGLALGSAAALFVIAVLTAGGTVPEIFIAAGFVLAILGYAVAVQQAARDTPFVRPWLAHGVDDPRRHRADGPW